MIERIRHFKLQTLIWWVGAPALLSVLFYGAFVSFRLVYHLSPWWRIPVATQNVFDSYLYYQWIAAAAQHVPLGEWFYWLVPDFRILWSWTGGRLSVPEFVILTQIVCLTLSAWVLPWALRQWSSLTVPRARWISFGFLFAWSLTLGFRPGVYSTYLPFMLAGIGCLGIFFQSLAFSKEPDDPVARPTVAILSACAALFLTSLYPWFLGFGIVFIAAAGWWKLLQVRRRLAFIFFAMASVASVVIAWMLAPTILSPMFAGVLGQYERTGVTFTHLPFITNTTVALIGWLILIALAAHAGWIRGEDRHGGLPLLHFFAWSCLLLLWFHYPFTGLYIHNEHFEILAILLGVFSVSAIAAHDRPVVGSKRVVAVLLLIAGVATLSYVTAAVRGGWFLTPYLEHILVWLSLAFAAALLFFHRHDRRAFFVLIAIWIALGAWGYASLLIRQWPHYPSVLLEQSLIDWIRRDGSPQARYCTDTQTASVLAAHTGRRFYPAEGVIAARESNEVYFSRLETIASAFDVRGSGELPMWDYYSNYAQFVACEQFPYQVHFLGWLGVASSTIDQLTGCRRAVMQANWDRVHRAIDHPESVKHQPLAAVCERVIITDQMAPFWHLPKTAKRLTRISSDSVWTTK